MLAGLSRQGKLKRQERDLCRLPTSFLSHACARVSLTTSDVFVTCDTTKRTGFRACHVFHLFCNQSLLSLSDGFTKLPEVVFPMVNISIPKIVYIQFYYKNNEFRFKNEFKRQAHICKFATPWTVCGPWSASFSNMMSYFLAK